MSCFEAAASASSAIFSIYAFLSALALFFTSLSSALYNVCSCAFCLCDLVVRIFFFFSFLSSIFLHVSSDIQTSFLLLLGPSHFSPASSRALLKLYRSSSCWFCKTVNLFFTWVWKDFLTSGSFGFATFIAGSLWSIFLVFLSFNLIFATTSVWSLPTSAPRFATTS